MEINRIFNSDCLTGLKQVPNDFIDCCVTSPPYFGLRDYGTATWDGGDSLCDHAGKPMATKANINQNYNGSNDIKNGEAREFYKVRCGKCGATRIDSQIGLELTPELYVEKMCEVFTEVFRTLKPEGTLWLNIGDTYYNYRGQSDYPTAQTIANHSGHVMNSASGKRNFKNATLKGKDLIGIPWMVAFALRSRGWYLRQDIIWNKPNPMPESVTDRCTKAHEYIFLMSKSSKYYYDAESIKTEMICSEHDKRSRQGRKRFPTDKVNGIRGNTPDKVYEFANKRSVWTVNTKPYAEAHFATFPEELIVDCIKAGCPENGIVLDPFAGTNTTGMVARKLNRNYISFELNPAYIKIADKRIYNEMGMFLNSTPTTPSP